MWITSICATNLAMIFYIRFAQNLLIVQKTILSSCSGGFVVFAKFAKDTPKYELQIVKYLKAQYAP